MLTVSCNNITTRRFECVCDQVIRHHTSRTVAHLALAPTHNQSFEDLPFQTLVVFFEPSSHLIIIIIMAEWQLFNVAGYLIE